MYYQALYASLDDCLCCAVHRCIQLLTLQPNERQREIKFDRYKRDNDHVFVRHRKWLMSQSLMRLQMTMLNHRQTMQSYSIAEKTNCCFKSIRK